MTDIKKITKEDLKKIYYDNDQPTASKKLGVSIPTMLRYVKKLKIKMKGAGRKKGQTKIRLEL